MEILPTRNKEEKNALIVRTESDLEKLAKYHPLDRYADLVYKTHDGVIHRRISKMNNGAWEILGTVSPDALNAIDAEFLEIRQAKLEIEVNGREPLSMLVNKSAGLKWRISKPVTEEIFSMIKDSLPKCVIEAEVYAKSYTEGAKHAVYVRKKGDWAPR